jgi:hypothetical protein
MPADLSPGLAEIIRLAQAHVDEGVILAYIQNSGQAYAPTAEEILYLSDLGLPQNVIAALYKTKPPATLPSPDPSAIEAALADAPQAEPVVPEATSDASFFYNDLAPYGAWVQSPDYGAAWQPTVETIDPLWCPYLDHGQWLDSDSGWYWLSDYTWGWAVFHYGRWAKEPRLGWVWVPGKLWASSWVVWRSTGSYFGWAPLPPGATRLAAAKAVPASSFVFVSAESFLSRNLPGKIVPAPRAGLLFARSKLAGSYSTVNNKMMINGISREAVAAAARKEIKRVTLRSVAEPAPVWADRATVPVYRPEVSAGATPVGDWSSVFLLHKPAKKEPSPPAATEREPVMADVSSEEAGGLPASPGLAEPNVQLPPLSYGGTAPPQPVKRIASTANSDGKLLPQVYHRQKGGHLDPVARPSTPPPRVEGGAQAQNAGGPAPAMEARRPVEDSRAAPPLPPRTAAAPAPPSPPGNPTSSVRR